MNFRDDILESVSLLPPGDPERRKLEAELPQAPPDVRRRYAELVAEAQGLSDLLTANAAAAPTDHGEAHALALPESLLGRLRNIPGRTPVRHPHFLTPFRAVAAAAILLLMLAPATAWFFTPAMIHHRLLALPRDVVAAADAPPPMAATQPAELAEMFARSSLSFMPEFPDPRPGATVLGGGITALVGRPAAFTIYGLKGKQLVVFEVARADFPLPDQGSYPMICTTAGDRVVRFWSPDPESNMLFLAVVQCANDDGLENFLQLPAAATQP
jgi:hypothetical protein